MSFLQAEIPSPRQALATLRQRSAGRPSKQHPARAPRLRSRAGVVGLEFEPGFATVVETVPGSVRVRRAAVLKLDADVVRDGEVADPEALGNALKDFFAEQQLPLRVRIGLANQRIVMRTIDLPPITDERQLASAISFQAQEHIAMPLENAVLEHQSLGLVGTPDGPRSRVVLVAARREMIDRVLQATRIAGLRLEGIDLSAFALIRALHHPEDDETQVAYINIGATTNLAVAAGTQCVFTRVIPLGLETMVSDLATRGGLTPEHARGWLEWVGLTRPLDEIEGQPDLVSSAREVLQLGVSAIASEIRSTLSFYATQSGGVSADRAVASGLGASIDGFVNALATQMDMPVVERSVAEDHEGALNGVAATQLAVAAGLTVTEAPA